MGGYAIPKHLQNEKDAYIFSFANRTKRNLQFIKEVAKQEEKEGKKGKDVTVFEVTQLINSMIGLVTFPKEAFYEKALHKGNGKDASVYLADLIEKIEKNPKEYEYENTYLRFRGKKIIEGKESVTYSKDRFEWLNVMNFIRHFRNALSHEKLSVYPYNMNFSEEIKGFVFEDVSSINVVDDGDRYIKRDGYGTIQIQQNFKIKLTVEQIENIAMDICDMLLAVAKDTYKIKEDIDEFY